MYYKYNIYSTDSYSSPLLVGFIFHSSYYFGSVWLIRHHSYWCTFYSRPFIVSHVFMIRLYLWWHTSYLFATIYGGIPLIYSPLFVVSYVLFIRHYLWYSTLHSLLWYLWINPPRATELGFVLRNTFHYFCSSILLFLL